MVTRAEFQGENELLTALSASDYSQLRPYLKEVALEQGSVLQDHGERELFPTRRSGPARACRIVRSEGTSGSPDRFVVGSKVVRIMNSLIYLVGLVVVVGFILNFVMH